MIWPVQQHSTLQKQAYWVCRRADEEVLADAFEALVGAVYLDSGIEAASRFLIGLAEVSVVCTLLPCLCTEHCQSEPAACQPQT